MVITNKSRSWNLTITIRYSVLFRRRNSCFWPFRLDFWFLFWHFCVKYLIWKPNSCCCYWISPPLIQSCPCQLRACSPAPVGAIVFFPAAKPNDKHKWNHHRRQGLITMPEHERGERGNEWIIKFPLKSLISVINAGKTYLPLHLRGILMRLWACTYMITFMGKVLMLSYRHNAHWKVAWFIFLRPRRTRLTSDLPWGLPGKCFPLDISGIMKLRTVTTWRAFDRLLLLPAVVASTSVVFLSPMKSNWYSLQYFWSEVATEFWPHL